MLSNVRFHWLASACSEGRRALEKSARSSLEEFFKHCEKDVEVMVTVAKLSPGASTIRIVKEVPRHEYLGQYHPNALSVNIWTEGTQGIVSLIEVDGMGLDEVRTLIGEGPYKKRPKKPVELLQPEGGPSPQAVQSEKEPITVEKVLSEEVSETPSPDPSPVEQSVIDQVPKLTPKDKLEKAKVPPEEIERLKATLSSIISRRLKAQGETGIPNTLQVPVEEITAAIMEHQKLPRNSADNYRGIIGNFYSTRIALFALKYEYRLDEEDQYTDWLFDCNIVLDFVGGEDNLAALTRTREVEVRERLEEEANREPAPPATTVEVAVKEGFLPDNSIFELAMRVLEGRKLAEAEIERARANVESCAKIVTDLESKLEAAKEELRRANEHLEEAVRKREAFVIAPDVLAKVREAKARLDKLAKDLGI